MKRTVTMKQISEKAGVSLTTVSRALQNRPEISQATTRRIQDIAREMGFTRKIGARTNRPNDARTVGVIVADNSNPFFGTVLKGMEDTLSASGYGLILCNTDEIYRKEAAALKMLAARKVDGFLITPTQVHPNDIADLLRLRYPVVLVGRRFPGLDTDYVIADDEAGAFAATDHLLRLGHQRVVFLNAPDYISSAAERRAGYRRAYSHHNVAISSELIRQCNPKLENAYNTMRSLIVEKAQFSAVFAFNDLMAMGQ
jgi:LacI family transcriptional regulator